MAGHNRWADIKRKRGPIELAAQDQATELAPEVARVLEALGHPEALITDKSMIFDFFPAPLRRLVARADIENVVYGAIIGEIESREFEKGWTGNGHHFAQKLMGMVVDKLIDECDVLGPAERRARVMELRAKLGVELCEHDLIVDVARRLKVSGRKDPDRLSGDDEDGNQ